MAGTTSKPLHTRGAYLKKVPLRFNKLFKDWITLSSIIINYMYYPADKCWQNKLVDTDFSSG